MVGAHYDPIAASFARQFPDPTFLTVPRFVYDSALPVGRLVKQVADKSQICTQRSWKRPYGVGLLVAGEDTVCVTVIVDAQQVSPAICASSHSARAVGLQALEICYWFVVVRGYHGVEMDRMW